MARSVLRVLLDVFDEGDGLDGGGGEAQMAVVVPE
jgi:hypothetical protein